ncbi:MAG: Mur ligase family protein [Bacteroidales bacterium]
MINLEIPQVYELYISSTGVCTDTRNIKEGCMFFALKGETFNGNNFAQSALQQGAKYVVIDDSTAYVNTESMILVNNVLVTLQQLARYYRLRYKIPVIALTGTNGKTTTKELITAALSTKYNVVSTKGNLNNHIGVPLTLLSINSNTQIAVIEMGASSPGEIEALVKLVCPSFGLITNVGKAHLLGFGSFEGVKKTKGELYDNLVEYRKIAFVNTDNPHLVEMVRQRPTMQIVPYGVKSNCVQIVTYPIHV